MSGWEWGSVMPTSIRRLSGFVIAAGTAAALAVGTVSAAVADSAVAPPPSATEVVQATNAMLDITDDRTLLTGSAADAGFSTGYLNPPGGQDPYPVCDAGPGYRPVSIPDALAVGYQARNGTLTQMEYVYPSVAAGAQAWATLDKRIEARCSGDWSDAEGIKKVTRTALPEQGSAGAGWAVTTVMDQSTMHVVVRPVDGGIQSLIYYTHQDTNGSSTMKPTVPSAMKKLSVELADRWAARTTLPIDTERMASWVAPAMLQSSDIPAALPVIPPAAGGWSSFSASAPAESLMTCGKDAPLGTWSFSSDLGDPGDGPGNPPGTLWQQVSMYQTADSAAEAWRQLNRTILACNRTDQPAVSSTRAVIRTQSGNADFGVDGVPALWYRQFASYPDEGLSTKVYQVYLLVDNTIQRLQYVATLDGLRQVPLDQLAVNTLADELADRWVAAASSAE